MKKIIFLFLIILFFFNVFQVTAVNFIRFWLKNDLNNYKAIIEDANGTQYLIEYGVGCLSLWSYESSITKKLYIDIGGSFLDGIGDKMYLLDNDQSCTIWDAKELGNTSLPKIDFQGSCIEVVVDGIILYTKNFFDSNSNTINIVDYYDSKCVTPIDYELEKEVENAYKNKCQNYTFNKLLIYNIKIGKINKTEWLANLSDNCTQEIKLTPKVLGATSSLFVNSEETLVKQVDEKLVNKLKGYILLQTEEHGEAWYIDPTTSKKYYMQDGPTAYEMMRSFGLGITDKDLNKIPAEGSNTKGDTTLINKLKGKILLQIQQHGEAWYVNPKDGKRYYLKDGNEAYRIMRIFSLGITNKDLRKITVGRIEDMKK